jgi:hypothetical protein
MSAVTNAPNTGRLPSFQKFDAKDALGWTAMTATVVGSTAALAATSAKLAGEGGFNPATIGLKAAGVTAAVVGGVMLLKGTSLPKGHESGMYSGMGVGAITGTVEAAAILGILAPKAGGNWKALAGSALFAGAAGAAIGSIVGLASSGTPKAGA